MKTTLLTPALAAVLGLALAGAPVAVHAQSAATTAAPAPVTTAAPAAKPAPAAKLAAPKKTEYKGTLLVIDATANTITVQNTKTKLVLAVAPATVITKDKKPAALTDFVVGSYTKNADGTMTAASLKTKTAAPAKTATAPKPAPAAKPAASAVQ